MAFLIDFGDGEAKTMIYFSGKKLEFRFASPVNRAVELSSFEHAFLICTSVSCTNDTSDKWTRQPGPVSCYTVLFPAVLFV